MNDDTIRIPKEPNSGLRECCERFCSDNQMEWTKEFQHDFSNFISHFDFEVIQIKTDDTGLPKMRAKLVINKDEPEAE